METILTTHSMTATGSHTTRTSEGETTPAASGPAIAKGRRVATAKLKAFSTMLLSFSKKCWIGRSKSKPDDVCVCALERAETIFYDHV
jgi:hypothetical protein